MRNASWQRSPWDADPLSWFTAPNLPLAALLASIVNSVLVLGPLGQSGSRPGVQILALMLTVAGLAWVQVATRPHRGSLSFTSGLIAVLLATGGLVLSALGYRGEVFVLELWWAPLSVSLLLLALVPYVSALRLLVYGAIQLAICGVTVALLVVPDDPSWPPFSTVVITLFPLVIGLVGGTMLIRGIAGGLARWSERPLETGPASRSDEAIADAVDAQTRLQIADATALIAAVLDRGRVEPEHRERAAEIAERLRADYRAAADATWLERVVAGGAVWIDDPDRLAGRLDLGQRTAMRALLDAMLSHPESSFASARIELRQTAEGSIAVALRILSALPEGRRESFLVPYYLSLRSTVENLRWRRGAVTALDFEVSGAGVTRSPIARTADPVSPSPIRRPPTGQ